MGHPVRRKCHGCGKVWAERHDDGPSLAKDVLHPLELDCFLCCCSVCSRFVCPCALAIALIDANLIKPGMAFMLVISESQEDVLDDRIHFERLPTELDRACPLFPTPDVRDSIILWQISVVEVG